MGILRMPSAVTPAGSELLSALPLEQELQSKLNQSRICSWGGSRYDAEILIVGRAADGVRGGELSSVENVKELSTELKTESLAGCESRSFEHRKVKIIDAIGP